MNSFEEKFKKIYNDSIYTFIDDFEGGKNPLSLSIVSNNDNISYDSCGSENSTLERVFFDSELNIYVKFTGTRCSYEGEEWNQYKIVTPKTKTITIYE